MGIKSELRETAAYMARELEENRLVVVLIPAPIKKHPGHKIRAVESRNPAWYREFCAAHQTSRSIPRKTLKPDTMIKRNHTIAALHRLANGKNNSPYTERLLPIVEDYDNFIRGRA